MDIKRQLRRIFRSPASIPAASIQDPHSYGKDEINLLKTAGVMQKQLEASLTQIQTLNYERMSIYREVDRSIEHWLMGAAIDLYADVATAFSPLHNATVWITGEKEYITKLTKFLEDINVEECITDWAWTTGGYGDMEIKVDGEPGKGIISIDDSLHPANISRIDYKGVLLGFFETPQETGGATVSTTDCNILPPWDYVHFRLLGAKKRRPMFGNEVGYAESRTSLLIGSETKQLTTKYGVSLLLNGLPVYKRLRMSEDSLLLTRLTRGILRYIYMIAVGDSNTEAAGSIVQEYMNLIKHTNALDKSALNPNFESKSSQLSSVEDIFLPVFGADALNTIKIEKLGGEPDIKWITDIDTLRNQLACALRVPLSLLGGFVQEASGQLGTDSIEQLDIRFARNTRRLQRSLINGITRLCQIHLAYLGMDPDTTLFQVNMAETSSTEEKKLRESVKEGTDSISSFMDILENLDVKIDKVGVLDYLNKKMLKLSDFELQKYVMKDILPEIEDEDKRVEVKQAVSPQTKPAPSAPSMNKVSVTPQQAKSETGKDQELTIADSTIRATNLDLLAPLPLNDNATTRSNFQKLNEWKTAYGSKKVTVMSNLNEKKS